MDQKPKKPGSPRTKLGRKSAQISIDTIAYNKLKNMRPPFERSMSRWIVTLLEKLAYIETNDLAALLDSHIDNPAVRMTPNVNKRLSNIEHRLMVVDDAEMPVIDDDEPEEIVDFNGINLDLLDLAELRTLGESKGLTAKTRKLLLKNLRVMQGRRT